jgi:hypothetical protein
VSSSLTPESDFTLDNPPDAYPFGMHFWGKPKGSLYLKFKYGYDYTKLTREEQPLFLHLIRCIEFVKDQIDGQCFFTDVNIVREIKEFGSKNGYSGAVFILS